MFDWRFRTKRTWSCHLDFDTSFEKNWFEFCWLEKELQMLNYRFENLSENISRTRQSQKTICQGKQVNIFPSSGDEFRIQGVEE